jgi:hypothetical protein
MPCLARDGSTRGEGSPEQTRRSTGGLLPRRPRGTSAPRASSRGRAARPRPPRQAGGGATSPSRSRESSRLNPSKAHGAKTPRSHQLNHPTVTRRWISTTVLSEQLDRPAEVGSGLALVIPAKGVRTFSPNTLTDGVPKVPKGCSEGFCHFWHLVTLGFSRNTRPHTQRRRDGY